jgi:hypothetical protein
MLHPQLANLMQLQEELYGIQSTCLFEGSGAFGFSWPTFYTSHRNSSALLSALQHDAFGLTSMLICSPVPYGESSSGCVMRPMCKGRAGGAQGAPEGIAGDEWLS